MRLVCVLLTLAACRPDKGGAPSDTGAWVDADGDGVAAQGGDCDDDNPDAYPGAPEACDGVDLNCDGLVDQADATDATTWYTDADGDGQGDDATATVACEAPTGMVPTGGDCDDGDADVFTGAPEVCDFLDDDCDGEIDEDTLDGASTWYADLDGDGYGDPDVSEVACGPEERASLEAGDCDDDDAEVYAGATEACSARDEDCDGVSWCAQDIESTAALLVGADLVAGWDDSSSPAYRVGAAGDLDGDGVGDLYVTCLYCTEHYYKNGLVTLISGETRGSIDVYESSEPTLYGSYLSETGHAVVEAGDLDASGTDDLLVGTAGDALVILSPLRGGGDDGYVPDATIDGAGSALAVLSDADGVPQVLVGLGHGAWIADIPLADATDIDAATALVSATDDDDEIGQTVAAAGDVDGDGVQDALLGAPGVDEGATDGGAELLFLGPLLGEISAEDADARLLGVSADDQVGEVPGSSADLDGDGRAEILIGAPHADRSAANLGVVYGFYGPPAGDRSLADAELIVAGTEEDERLGAVVSGGDLDGDGAQDLVIAETGNWSGSTSGGSVYILLAPGSGSLSTDDASERLSAGTGDDFGHALGVVPDLDGDGGDELMLSHNSDYQAFLLLSADLLP